MKVLVVGGAGFIGSHMVKYLADRLCEVTVLDDLSSGHRDAVLCDDFICGDVGNLVLLDDVLSRGFDAVMHFASFIQVGESIIEPAKYYHNNFVNTLRLLDSMMDHGVKNFVFSSTAATFGEPRYSPIDEKHPQSPINPYGRSKLMVEQLLRDYNCAYGLNYVALRYFNACGAHPDGILGERHEPETHLIPLLLQVASGRRSHISVFGVDYDTPDGTCVRDYVHVQDLCRAHWLALNRMHQYGGASSFNLGNGNGFSVLEVIRAVERVTSKSVPFLRQPRREGDPARLVADSGLARSTLGWIPEYPSLEDIIQHAWTWELNSNVR